MDERYANSLLPLASRFCILGSLSEDVGTADRSGGARVSKVELGRDKARVQLLSDSQKG